MSLLPSMPQASLVDIFKRWPAAAHPFHEYMQQVMRGPSPLAAGERELIGAFVSRLNGCDYCESSHTKTAQRFGVDASLVAALADDIDRADVEAKLKPLLQFVKQLTLHPDKIDQGDVDAVLEADWDEEAVHAAVQVCAAFNAVNRIVLGLGVEADEATAETAANMLHDKGYAAVGEML